jgi:hypothetical protein
MVISEKTLAKNRRNLFCESTQSFQALKGLEIRGRKRGVKGYAFSVNPLAK